MEFENEKKQKVPRKEVTNLFSYEDMLKQIILKKGIGRLALKNLQEETLKKIYVVPTVN